MKAYAVLEKYEYTGDIYFAEKAIYAAKAGADEYAEGYLGGVQCRRAPWADKYADEGVPAKVAIDHGWHFECHGCGIKLDSDVEEEHRLPLDHICGYVRGTVYCSPRCKWRTKRAEERRIAKSAELIAEFKKIVLNRFPDADFADDLDKFTGHHVYVDKHARSGEWNIRQVSIAFRFPGMKIGPAHFRLDDHHRYGPHLAYYTCCNGDREAFEEYALATRKSGVSR